MQQDPTCRAFPVRPHLALSAVLVGGAACGSRPAAPPKVGDDTAFLGTVRGSDIGNVRHPYLRWTVTAKVDQVLSGHRPGDSFWFAIHSPSQDYLKVGQRLTIRAMKTAEG